MALDAAWLLTGGLSGWARWLALVVVVVAHVACVLALGATPDAVPRRWLGAAVVGLALLAAVVPVSASHDVYLYAMEGRILGVHHVNPYRVPPAHFPHDPLLAHVAGAWRHTVGAYGPLFQVVAAAGSLVYGTSPLLARLWFQLVAATALAGSALLLLRRRAAPWAVALVGLAPAALATVNDAHIDMAVGAGLLVGVLLLRDGRSRAAGVLLGLTLLVKVTALPAVGAVLLALVLLRRWRDAVRVALPGAGVVGVGYLLFGGTLAVGPLQAQGTQLSRGSWASWVATTAHELGRTVPSVATDAHQRQLVAAVLALAVFGAVVWRWRHRVDPAELAVAATVVYLVTTNYSLAWYPAMVIPLLALCRARLAAIGLGLAVWFQLLYVSPASRLVEAPLRLAPARAMPVVAAALVALLLWARPDRDAVVRSAGGQLEPDDPAPVGVGAGPDPAAVAVDDLADDGQPET